MINIYKCIKRLLCGSTSKFLIRKGSTTLRENSYVSIYEELLGNPVQLMSIEFIGDDVKTHFRIIVDGQKIFPFDNESIIRMKSSMNFLEPIKIAANSFLQIEVRGEIGAENVIIMDELAIIEEV